MLFCAAEKCECLEGTLGNPKWFCVAKFDYGKQKSLIIHSCVRQPLHRGQATI